MDPSIPSPKTVILVVEDEPKDRKLMRDLLTVSGYTVLEATDGQQGMDLAKNEKPDLILMDIRLPVVDGLEATRILKGMEETKHIPVVALTAYAMREDIQRILMTGCEGHISKPIDSRSFLESVKLYLFKELGPNGQNSTGAGGSHKWKILLADDDPKMLRLYEAFLPPDKYEVIKAATGQEALDRVAEDEPDAILLDIILPDIDGLEVTRRIKKDAKTKSIPIILVTSLDDSETKEIGIESGAEEFLNKPVQAMELLARIGSMIRLKQFRDQLAIRSQSSEILTNGRSEEEAKEPMKDYPFILLVEDNEVDAQRIIEALKDQPLRIEVAKTGKDAVCRIQEEKLDLVLLDILLPDINGFDILKNLKSEEETRDIQVVVITCLEDTESRLKGLELGAEDFLVKPIMARELQARVKVLIEKKGHMDRLRSHYESALDSAKVDWLTGLYNQGYFKQCLSLETKRSLRQRYPVSLIMIDIDDFKNLNDTLGHSAGDSVLKEIGQIILSKIREVDVVARYGGEEFAVILPYGDKEAARRVAQRIHQEVAVHDFLHDTSRRSNRLTVSMGVAAFPADALSAEELINKADEMLYKAKRNGKNQFLVYAAENGGTIAP